MKKSILIIGMALAVGLLMSSCRKEFLLIHGNGNIVAETLDVDPFSKLEMSGAFETIISYGTEQEVTVTGDSNIVDRIKTGVSNDTWILELERGQYGNYDLTFHITLPDIEEIVDNGVANITMVDFPKQEDFRVVLNGAGSFRGFNLPTENCTVEINGMGLCEVNAESTLDITIDGAGEVIYMGDPDVKRSIKGLGTVKRK
jgi:hypothetical protein